MSFTAILSDGSKPQSKSPKPIRRWVSRDVSPDIATSQNVFGGTFHKSQTKWGQSPLGAPAMKTKENDHKMSTCLGRKTISKDFSPVRFQQSIDYVSATAPRPHRFEPTISSSFSITQQKFNSNQKPQEPSTPAFSQLNAEQIHKQMLATVGS